LQISQPGHVGLILANMEISWAYICVHGGHALTTIESVELIRRDFATRWGRVVSAWGVAPSTAAVQGYLLAHGGPLTELDIRQALNISHRAALLALRQAHEWGMIEPAGHKRRAGQRGPAGRAWLPITDHWRWSHHVLELRRGREIQPLLPLLSECLERARLLESEDEQAAQLHEKLSELEKFAVTLDRVLLLLQQSSSEFVAKLLLALTQLDEDEMKHLTQSLLDLSDEQLITGLKALSSLSASKLRQRLPKIDLV